MYGPLSPSSPFGDEGDGGPLCVRRRGEVPQLSLCARQELRDGPQASSSLSVSPSQPSSVSLVARAIRNSPRLNGSANASAPSGRSPS